MMEPGAHHFAERLTNALESMAESMAYLAEVSPPRRTVMGVDQEPQTVVVEATPEQVAAWNELLRARAEHEATVDQTDERGEVYPDPREARYGRSEA